MNRSTPATRMAVVAALGALVGATFSVSPAEAGRPTDRPWSGFRIAQDNTAATPWVGARKLSKRVVYRIDPRAARESGPRFGPVKKVAKLSGQGRKVSAGRFATSRAAYILAKYGTVKFDVQSAAVDASLLHLLEGGKYRLSRAKGKNRILRTGRPWAVKRMARSLVGESARYAGPYLVTSAQRGTAVPGGEAQILVSVTAQRSGAGMEDLPVTVRSQGVTRTADTDGSGQALVSIPTPKAGTHRVDTKVNRVPNTRLLVRKPVRKAASRVAVAGVKRSLRSVGTVEVTAGSPKVRVFVTRNRTQVGKAPKGAFTVTGSVGDDARQVTIERIGPFAKGSQAKCRSGASPYDKFTTRTISADGTYSLPRWNLQAEGYYMHSVTVGANDANPKATACGAKVHAVKP